LKKEDLDKYIKFPAISKEKGNKLVVANAIGLDYTYINTEDDHVKFVEVSLMIFDDDKDVSVEIVPDQASNYKLLKIKYKWKDYEPEDSD
jgi:hypothetical protein